MKRIVFFVLILVFVAVFLVYPTDKNIELTLSVRVQQGDGPVRDLAKTDFKLYINGKLRQVSKCLPHSRNIAKKEGKRNFILAFNFTDYGKSITEAIAAFVDKILKEDDTLLVWSPTQKVYPLEVGKKDNKALAAEIEKIVKADSLIFKQKVEQFKRSLNGLTRSVAMENTRIQYFLNGFTREVNNFKNRVLMPDFRSYNEIAGRLIATPGETWLINFQEREVIPSIQKYRRVKNDIRNYLSGLTGTEAALAGSINSGLNTADKALMVSETYPQETVANFLLDFNIGYHALLFKSMRKTQGASDFLSLDFEDILRTLADKTGGLAIDSNDLIEGLEKIAAHIDHYYDLVFPFDGTSEEKTVKVEVTRPKTSVYYKTKFSKKDIDNRVQLLGAPQVQIVDYRLKGHKLSFKITDYKTEDDKKTTGKDNGILQVTIRLLDKQNRQAWKAAKTFKTTRDFFNISLNLPTKLKGFFKLSLGCVDMLTGKRTEKNEYVELK